ncbi:IS1111A family transposase [Salipiger mucosus DSM 16094]|uniref:IS1111A family transposase n=1 Tax=Salipiger mucosus DSM 16094 TaxID=1123237 RepID=S9QQD3_9RHOB|nr:IS1111A family transposase [Salipiger mucosus DSM 16094]
MVAAVADEEVGLPKPARVSLQVLTATLAQLVRHIEILDAEIDRGARENVVARRLMMIPGIGPLIIIRRRDRSPLSRARRPIPNSTGSRLLPARGQLKRHRSM